MNFSPNAPKKKSHLSGVPLNRPFLNKLFKLTEKDATHTAHAFIKLDFIPSEGSLTQPCTMSYFQYNAASISIITAAASFPTRGTPVLSQVHGTFRYLPQRWHKHTIRVSPQSTLAARWRAKSVNLAGPAIARLIRYTLLPFNQSAAPQRSCR